MGVVMNMSSYEIERDDAMEVEYGTEVLYSGWNPDIALASLQQSLHGTNVRMTIPSSLATLDAEAFLQKMYACQC